MYWFEAGNSNLEFGWFTNINLLSTFDLSFFDWVFSGLGYIALLIVRNIVESYTIILLTIVLRTIASDITEAILDYTSIVFNNMIILIILKVLYNIIATVK